MTPHPNDLRALQDATDELARRTGMSLAKCKVIVWGVFRRLSERELCDRLLTWCYGPRWRDETTAFAQKDAPAWIATAHRSGVRLPVWTGRAV